MSSNHKKPPGGEQSSAMVMVGCLTAFVIEKAKELGCPDHAEALETCLATLLKAMPKEQRRQTLMLAFDFATKNVLPEPVKLRLVHSRD